MNDSALSSNSVNNSHLLFSLSVLPALFSLSGCIQLDFPLDITDDFSNPVFWEIFSDAEHGLMDLRLASINSDAIEDLFALVHEVALSLDRERFERLRTFETVEDPVEALFSTFDEDIQVARNLVILSDIFSHESISAVERNIFLHEDLSGLISEISASIVIVKDENDAVEIADTFEYFLPVFAEVAAVRRYDAVAFLIESEPVEYALSNDEYAVIVLASAPKSV